MKLLIVDDDMQIRSGLHEGIDWATLGFDAVFSAADGDEALRIFILEEPEIVVTDIRMPGLDGLELSREIRNHSSLTNIILLSGYSDFDYARQALKYGVMDYLLKPVKISELLKTIKNAQEKRIMSDKHMEEQSIQKKVYQENFVEDVFHDRVLNRMEIEEHLIQYWQLDKESLVRVIIGEIDQAWRIPELKERRRIFSEMEDTIPEFIDETTVFSVRRENSIILIFTGKVGAGFNAFQYRLKEAHQKILSKLDGLCTISLAAGNPQPSGLLRESYLQASEALSRKLFLGFSKVHFVNETGKASWGKMNELVEPIHLKKAISAFNTEVALGEIHRLFHDLRDRECDDYSWVDHLCAFLRNLLVTTIKEEGFDYKGLFERNMSLFEHPELFETLDEFENWLCDLYEIVLTGLAQMKGAGTSISIRKAVEYIVRNYMKNLTVEDVAEVVQKSPNYFSHLFKKEMGVAFSEYLNRYRIQEAKALLKSGNLLAYEIAEKVGFQDYKYFTQVFRKLEGCAPSDYRKGKG